MTEAQATFLCKIASTLSSKKETHAILRSHYLMKCKKIASIKLPEKQFSSLTRCSHCCLEWKKGTEVNLKSIKLTKRQRHRIKRLKNNNTVKFSKKEILLHGNKMEQICTFCGYNTVTHLNKPDKPVPTINHDENEEKPTNGNIKNNKDLLKTKVKNKDAKSKHYNNYLPKIKNNLEINVYSNTHDVFALNNKGNTLPNILKDPPKVIKNNKRKKDKFAGLCEKAVLASAKLKQEQQKHDAFSASAKLKQGQQKLNKLNLFLKPST